MSRRTLSRILPAVIFLVCSGLSAGAQAYGGYSPYSIFGVGDMSRQGTAYNMTMGGTGIANRNNRFLNVMNPAAVTARDSLAFMADFSLYGDNKIYRQSDMRSANNTFNINDFVISFPIYRSSAMMVGIMPYSDTGFGYSFSYTDPSVIGNTGNLTYAASGNGSIYKTFAAAGVTFFDRLSLGAEVDYYFGNLSKSYNVVFSDASHNSITNSTSLQATGVGGKFGLQYEQPLGSKLKLGVGAVYSTGASLKGFYEDARFSSGSSVSDTLYYRMDTLGVNRSARLAGEIGVGVSLRYANKWMVEFDYTRSDWSNTGVASISGFDGSSSPFVTSMSESYRVGFEYIPNINDIRYYLNKVAYRGGAYYRKEYYLLNGHEISSMGITLGATFPIFRWYNGLTVGVDLGQRGSLSDSLVRERYINFSIGINIFDIWFQKSRYE